MKRLLVLGGGTAGTMIVNKLRRGLDAGEWEMTIVDQDDAHHYQPGYLFLPVRYLYRGSGHPVAARLSARRGRLRRG